MLSKIKIIIIASLLALNVYAAPKQNQTKEIVAKEIESFMREYDVPGVAVELYVDGKPYAYYFGMADKKRKKPVVSKTIFELGSLTKLYTTFLLADAVDSAKLQLNDSITAFLPQLPAAYQDITFLNLATHTAGLPVNAPESIDTDKKLVPYLQEWAPETAVGTERLYSNLGIRVLGLAIEKVEKKDLNTLYIQKIFNRLQMQPLGLRVPKSYRPYYAQGYNADGNSVPALQDAFSTAAGGAKATASDMQHFLAAAIGLQGTPDRLLYPIRLTQAPYVVLPDFNQGLGWDVHSITEDNIPDLLAVTDENYLNEQKIISIDDKPIFNKNDLIDKTGATDGFRSYIAVIPGEKSGIVILANKNVLGKPIVLAGRAILFKLNHI